MVGDLLARAATAGVEIRVEDGRLRIRALASPPADLMAELRASREDIIAALTPPPALAPFSFDWGALVSAPDGYPPELLSEEPLPEPFVLALPMHLYEGPP